MQSKEITENSVIHGDIHNFAVGKRESNWKKVKPKLTKVEFF